MRIPLDGPTPESIQAAKRDNAEERRKVTAATGLEFDEHGALLIPLERLMRLLPLVVAEKES